MTSTQKMALDLMREERLGAVVTRRGWTWPEDVRNDNGAALAVVEQIEMKRVADAVRQRDAFRRAGYEWPSGRKIGR